MSADVVIIGAGPAGSLAATLLVRRGHRVLICERAHFPRFQIGESLLPQAMVWLEEAGLLPGLEAENFQPKNGAVFRMGARQRVIDFHSKTTAGPATTWQVPRERFDLVLAEGARAAGTEIRFGCRVTAFQPGEPGVSLSIEDEAGTAETIAARFVLDASGFGRVLAGLLELEHPSPLPPRSAVFTHVRDGIRDARFDREKILISIHPEIRDVWYWLIPFRDGLASIGAVGPAATIDGHGASDEERLARLVTASGFMGEILAHAEPARPTGRIDGYSRGVLRLSGPGYALLGNAAEFLDPIFSSGVTIAMKSASLAAGVLDRQLRGELVDWQEDYETPLKTGIETFRAHVEAWYEGGASGNHSGFAERWPDACSHDYVRPGRLCMGHQQPLRASADALPGDARGDQPMIERIRKPLVGSTRLVTCAAVMALLQGCSHPASWDGPVPAGHQGILTLPVPPGYPAPLTVVQQVHAVHGGQETHLEALLQLSEQRVSVVFTLPLGPRVATIQWTGEGVRVRRDLDTSETRRIPAERVLADLVLAFWPEDSVAAHLHPGLSLAVGADERRVLRGNVPLAEVRIEDGGNPWNGRTVVVHHELDYRITIDGRIPPSA